MSTWMINSKTNMLWATSIAIGATNNLLLWFLVNVSILNAQIFWELK